MFSSSVRSWSFIEGEELEALAFGKLLFEVIKIKEDRTPKS